MPGQNNFENTLPESIKKQAILAIKDEYSLNFAGLDEEHSEADNLCRSLNNRQVQRYLKKE